LRDPTSSWKAHRANLSTSAGFVSAHVVSEQLNAEELAMQISEVMTRTVRTITPDETISQAAKMMAEIDTGAIPVGDNDRLVGMITDRDIAVRAVAQDRGPETKVRDIMTPDVKYCFEDEDVDKVVNNMGEIQVRRLPVVSRDKRLVGTISMGDIAISAGPGEAGQAEASIAQPGGEHSQTGG